jgi:trimethylamine--corrinoid protein Co-methyltransferase
MQPKLSLLNDELIARIIEEAYQLMIKPGIKVQNAEARKLLDEAGALVDEETMIVKIPEQIVRNALETVPHQFHLYDYEGNPKVQYGGDAVQFDPGSSGISVLIPEHSNTRPPKPRT